MKATAFLEAGLDLVFPRHCLGCGREGAYFCPACSHDLPRILPPVCALCGLPLAPGEVCRDHGTLGVLDGLRAPFRFEGAIRQAVHALKYQGLKDLAGTLSNLLCDYFLANPLPADVLVPVPLHPRRLRQRGYNQSELIAKRLGSALGLPVDVASLVRTRMTAAQATSQDLGQRRANVQDAFSCQGKTSGMRVVIMDDVATSGATLAACAMALKDGGASSVWGLTLAREI